MWSLVVCVAVGNAFVVQPPPKKKTACSAAPVVQAALAGPTLYALMSVNEYITHRYYQHAEFNKTPWMRAVARLIVGRDVRVRGGGHVEHHAETLDDMTLKTDDNWRGSKVAKTLDHDPYRGTAFSWVATALMTLQMLPTTLPAFHLLGFSVSATLAILLPGMLLHALIWNALHPNMHSLPDVPLADGAPSKLLARFRDSAYFKYLYANHEGHHVVGGRGNYNVACPGTDHLMGTYVPEKVWKPLVSSSYLSHHGETVSVTDQINNHIIREEKKVAAT